MKIKYHTSWHSAVLALSLMLNPLTNYAGPAPANPDMLGPEGDLKIGESLWSLNGKYRLWFQTDGNLVVYDWTDPSKPKPKWCTGTVTPSVDYVKLSATNGNLVIYSTNAYPMWQLRTAEPKAFTTVYPNACLRMNDDGNLVLYDKDMKVVWQLNEYLQWLNELETERKNQYDRDHWFEHMGDFFGFATQGSSGSAPVRHQTPYHYVKCTKGDWRSGDCPSDADAIKEGLSHAQITGHTISSPLVGYK